MSRLTDRRARIEVLRARAQFERTMLERAACEVLDSLHPGALATQASAGLRAAGMGWLGTAIRAMRRYPVMLSLASSVFSGVRRRNPYIRVGVTALLAWRLLRARKP